MFSCFSEHEDDLFSSPTLKRARLIPVFISLFSLGEGMVKRALLQTEIGFGTVLLLLLLLLFVIIIIIIIIIIIMSQYETLEC